MTMKKRQFIKILMGLALAGICAFPAFAQYEFNVSGQTAQISQDTGTGDMIFSIGGAEKFRIKADGRAIVQKGVVVSNESTCEDASEGTIRYTSTSSKWNFCDGRDWKTFTSEAACPVSVDGLAIYSPFGGGFEEPPNTVFYSALGYGAVKTDNCAATVSVSGPGSPEFRICSAADCSAVVQNWTSTPTAIQNGQYLQIRMTTSSVLGETRNITVSVGGTYTVWSVTTRPLARTVFVTSSTYTGVSFGGVGGADHFCNSLAAAASLAGEYRAWISDGNANNDPESRLFHETVSYRLPAGNLSSVIANNWNDLVGLGYINLAINRNESNVAVAAVNVWTNTNADGTMSSATNHCTEWRANTTPSTVGNTNTTGTGWTNNGSGTNCSTNNYRLYCFQQPDETPGTAGVDYKRVFVTSATYTGVGVAGVAGADAKCAARATAAGLSGTYKAWIADSTAASAPATRFTQPTIPYRMVNATARKVADNWTDLTNGNLDTGIVYNESGAFVNNAAIWTNVQSNGTQHSSTAHCSNWSANTSVPTIGYTGNISEGWTNSGAGVNCSTNNNRLLCFEQ